MKEQTKKLINDIAVVMIYIILIIPISLIIATVLIIPTTYEITKAIQYHAEGKPYKFERSKTKKFF